ncbi:MAG: glycosyltransferase family 2 protein [Chloroflexi bacterium CFX7]|nr:glycosyltransferase family 2 protein [Chloroflexi bacterium CFX7]
MHLGTRGCRDRRPLPRGAALVSPGIVIVTFRCRDLALACLESLAAHLPHALPATVVVDNASGDGTVEAVRERFPAVTVIEERSNLGFAAAANSGIRALPGCRIENMDGTIQPSCRAFPGHLTALFNRHSLATRFLPGNRWSQRYLMTEWNHEDVREVDWVSGACMLIHRRAIDRVGLLDPAYFFSIEDGDYCRRVHDAGLAVRYFPAARIQHRVGGSTKHAAYRAMYAHHRGMWTYYRRHMRGSIPMDALTAAGIGARLGVHVVSYTLRRLRQRIFAAV